MTEIQFNSITIQYEDIQEQVSPRVYSAVIDLTKPKQQDYLSYITTIIAKGTQLTQLVKLADICDNLITAREAGVREEKITMYKMAKKLLTIQLKGDK